MSDTLVCSIELSKTKGISLTVRNAAQKLTQTVIVDGATIVTQIKQDDSAICSSVTQSKDAIVTKIASDADTSTVTQNPQTFQVQCKNFIVSAESVTVKSTQKTAHESGSTYSIVSQADLTGSATTSMSLHAGTQLALASDATLSLTARSDLSASAINVSVAGSATTAIKGNGTMSVAGAQVSVSGDAQVTLAAPITKVGQNITTIEGQLVEVKGALVKLG